MQPPPIMSLALCLLAGTASAKIYDGTGLHAFAYGKRQTAADTKFWVRENWGGVATEVLDVLSTDSQSQWARKYPLRSTLAHETCHAIATDMTEARGDKVCPSFNQRAFYLMNHQGTCLEKPSGFNKDHVRDYIAQEFPALKWGRYKTYLTEINKAGDPLLLFNEWNCYIVGALTAYDVWENDLFVDDGKLPGRVIAGSSKETDSTNVGLGAVEFMNYAFAVVLTAEERDPGYLTGDNGEQVKEFVARNVLRTFNVFCKLLQLAKANPPIYHDSNLVARYEMVKTGAEGAKIRALGERLFGKEWWERQLNCENTEPLDVPTPVPPTPAPDYGPDCKDRPQNPPVCEYYKEYGYCTDPGFVRYMKDNCRYTCLFPQYCDVSPATPPTPAPATSPATPKPETPEPPTPTPRTPTPRTPTPRTPTPRTPAPQPPATPPTPAPTTPPTAPGSPPGTTGVPATGVPETGAPATIVPPTAVPTTVAPGSPPGTTGVPGTAAPATLVPPTGMTPAPTSAATPPSSPPLSTAAPTATGGGSGGFPTPAPTPVPPVKPLGASEDEDEDEFVWWPILVSVLAVCCVCGCVGAGVWFLMRQRCEDASFSDVSSAESAGTEYEAMDVSPLPPSRKGSAGSALVMPASQDLLLAPTPTSRAANTASFGIL